MTDLFISYSRDDRAFVEKLHAAVKASERDAWLDKFNIEKGEKFWQEIERGIDGANAFVFVISPTSIKKAAGAEEYCRWEIEYAVRQGKRIIPIVWRDRFQPNERVVDWLDKEIPAHRELMERNWLEIYDQDFESCFSELIGTYKKDLEYVKLHTKLLEAALAWIREGRKDSDLIRGESLSKAEIWLKRREEKIIQIHNENHRQENTDDFKPTEDQRNFITQSRLAENASLERDKLNREAKEKADKTIRRGVKILALTVGGAIVAAGFSIYFGNQAQQASRLKSEAETGTRREQTATKAIEQFKEQQAEGLLTAMRNVAELKALVQDGRSLEDYPTVNPLLTLQMALYGVQEVQLKGHQGDVTSIDMNPDGKTIVTAGSDHTVRLWNLDGKELLQFKGHQEDVYFAKFSPDGKIIITAGYDNIRLWTMDGKELAQLKGSKGIVDSIQFNPDGKMIATVEANIVKFWTLDGMQKGQLTSQDSIKSMQFSPDGQTLVTAGGSSVGLWEMNGKELMQIKRPASALSFVSSVRFSPDGKLLATSEGDGIIRLWTVDGKALAEMKRDQGTVSSTPSVPDGNIRAIEFSPDSKTIFSVGADRIVRLWSIDGKELKQFTGHKGAVRSAHFSPDGKKIVTTAQDQIVRIWSLDDNEFLQFKGHQSWVEDSRISSDSQTIVTRGWKDAPRVWKLGDNVLIKFNDYRVHGYLMGVLREHLLYIKFSPDSKLIDTRGIDGPQYLWALHDKELVQLKNIKKKS
jgi:WD40 repeat protein